MTLTKKEGVWSDAQRRWTAFELRQSLQPVESFITTGEDGAAATVYTAAKTLDDVFEDRRRFLGTPEAAADPFGFWIRAYMDRARALASAFDNFRKVRLATDATVEEKAPRLRAPKDWYPADMVSGTNILTGEGLTVDGLQVSAGDRILVKDQYFEELTSYVFGRVNTRRVTVSTGTYPGVDDYFSLGNPVAFYDAGGNEVLRDVVTNLEVVVITGVPHVQFDTLVEVPADAVECADLVDGDWTRTTDYDQCGVYTYDGTKLILQDDTSTQEDMLDLIVWPEQGVVNTDKLYYLRRDDSGYYPTGSDDRRFEPCTPSVVESGLSYDANPAEPPYATAKMKAVVLDVGTARKLNAQQSVGDTEIKAAGGNMFEAMEFTATSSPVNAVQLILDTFPPGAQPNMEFRALPAVSVFQIDEGDAATFPVATDERPGDTYDLTGLSAPESLTDDQLVLGDVIRLRVLDGNGALFLDHVAVAVACSGAVIKIYPELGTEAVNDLLSLDAYTATFENLNMFGIGGNESGWLEAKVLAHPIGTYYDLSRSTAGYINFDYDIPLSGRYPGLGIAVGDIIGLRNQLLPFYNGTYVAKQDPNDPFGLILEQRTIDAPNVDDDDSFVVRPRQRTLAPLATDIITNNGTVPIVYADGSVYNPSYSVIDMVQQLDATAPSVLPATHQFTALPQTVYTYKNIDAADRFGFSLNSIVLGPGLSAAGYEPGLMIDVEIGYPSTTQTLTRRVVATSADASGVTTLRLNEAIPSNAAPAQGTGVRLKSRRTLQEVSDALDGWDGSSEVYARAMVNDSAFAGLASAVLYTDAVAPVVLLKDVSGASSDQRLLFEPSGVDTVGTDGRVSASIVVGPDDWFEDTPDKIVITPNAQLSKKVRFIDGLKEELILTPGHPQSVFAWILKPDVTAVNAIVGCTNRGNVLNPGDLVWYAGEWRNGSWEGGVWQSGTWRRGVWKGGVWNSYLINDGGGDDVQVITGNTRDTYSQFNGGRWETGVWNGGTFRGNNTVWVAGTWNGGTFASGTWTAGVWNGGTFASGVWNGGTWNDGDFETGDWLGGTWNSTTLSRFGTAATDVDRANWYGGVWNGGQFHSGLNIVGGQPAPSTNHSYSRWWSGTWNNGDWYGGTHVFGTWNSVASSTSSVWHAGVWLGGYPLSAVADVSAVVKRFTVDVSAYDATLGVTNAAHRAAVGQQVVMLAWVTSGANTTINNLYANMSLDSGAHSTFGGAPSFSAGAVRTVTSASDTQFTVSVSGGQNVASATYQPESSTTADGSPWLASLWNGGVFKRGLWCHGVFRTGRFEQGVFRRGLFVNGNYGLEVV